MFITSRTSGGTRSRRPAHKARTARRLTSRYFSQATRRSAVHRVCRRGSRHRRQHPAPPGVKAYLAGAAPQIADQFEVGNEGTTKVTILTVVVIAIMLLLVYRSLVTMLLVLVTVLIEMSCGPWNRGLPGQLRGHRTVDVLRPIFSRCWSSRQAPTTRSSSWADITKTAAIGQDRETAYYNMYRGTAHVILGSGLTVAGAVFCLSFTRLPYFQSLGIPAAIGRPGGIGGGADPGARGDNHR